ncbi:amidase (plasmid) [Rhodococcus pyridinivorans]|uniref:amidase n=1 Tax=Rhodococcus TaxID=1827 RepID=UPI000002CD32|nr:MULTISPECIES: amidase [Rhodococcus]AAA26183.1 enantiomerase-selective amidase [Rhodococcus sp. (in: high G+C Gram-positive bacteria)]MDV6296694.1 amidase [Rhodococcus aetherivorans]UPW06935.1 amidase [Rhodococcus pyridinivorans]
MGLHELTLAQVAAKIENKELSPVELLDVILARVAEIEPKISAFVTITADSARKAARLAADEIAGGHYRGPLHGVPIGLKDLFEVAGVPNTASSRVRADYIPSSDGAAVEKLTAGGAVMIGKTHTHEFAYGAITPTTRNPWDPTRTPGGSSGGTAAALAAGLIFAGMGTDTGGSIRIPAAVCGTVGLKPTYGRVSRRGVTSLSWSLDHAGPLARTVEDAAIMLNQIAGYDRADPATVDVPVPDYAAALTGDVRGLRIGVPTNFYTDNVHPEVAAAADAAVAQLAHLGAVVREVKIPMAEVIVPTEWSLLVPEASAYHQQMLRERADHYTDETRTFLEAGELVPATDYIKALRVRTLIQAAFRELFQDIDVLIAPTVSSPALPLDDLEVTWPDGTSEGGTITYVRLSAPGNVTGLPALSVPSGFTEQGLPTGIQIIGRPFDEETVLNVGHAYEGCTDWPRLAPL